MQFSANKSLYLRNGAG